MLVDGAGVGVRAPGHLLAADRAAVRHRCGVPGDLRREPARSCDDRPVPGRVPRRRSRCSSPRCWRCARGWAWASSGVVALDGMKIAGERVEVGEPDRGARCAKLAAETVARHAARPTPRRMTLFGEGAAGDEVPEDAGRPGGAASGSPRRWPACRPSARPPRRRGGRRRLPTWRRRRPGTPRPGRPPPGPRWSLPRR